MKFFSFIFKMCVFVYLYGVIYGTFHDMEKLSFKSEDYSIISVLINNFLFISNGDIGVVIFPTFLLSLLFLFISNKIDLTFTFIMLSLTIILFVNTKNGFKEYLEYHSLIQSKTLPHESKRSIANGEDEIVIDSLEQNYSSSNSKSFPNFCEFIYRTNISHERNKKLEMETNFFLEQKLDSFRTNGLFVPDVFADKPQKDIKKYQHIVFSLEYQFKVIYSFKLMIMLLGDILFIASLLIQLFYRKQKLSIKYF